MSDYQERMAERFAARHPKPYEDPAPCCTEWVHTDDHGWQTVRTCKPRCKHAHHLIPSAPSTPAEWNEALTALDKLTPDALEELRHIREAPDA